MHIEGAEGMLLEQDAAGFGRDWQPVCKAPCDKDLLAATSYRVVGEGMRTSAPFTLAAPAGGRDVIHVTPASKSGFVPGVVGTSLGGTAIATGLIMVLAGEISKSVANSDKVESPTGDALVTGGAITAAAGVALLFGGISLITSSHRSAVSHQMRVASDKLGSRGAPADLELHLGERQRAVVLDDDCLPSPDAYEAGASRPERDGAITPWRKVARPGIDGPRWDGVFFRFEHC